MNETPLQDSLALASPMESPSNTGTPSVSLRRPIGKKKPKKGATSDSDTTMYLAQLAEQGGAIQPQLQRERDVADMLRFEEHQRAREYSQKQDQNKIDREIMAMICIENVS